MNTLVCSVCKQELPDEAFQRRTRQKNRRGRTYECRKCTGIARREQYRNNPAQFANQMRAAYARNPELWKARTAAFRERNPMYKRSNELAKKYGLSLFEYNRLVEQQHGVCAICKKPESMVRKGKLLPLAVDHNHVTGTVRGLLCLECNSAIGKLKDDPALLLAAATYLMSDSDVLTGFMAGRAMA